MPIKKIFKVILAISATILYATSYAISVNPNEQLLPSPFAVYTDGTTAINHPAPGFNQILVPTVNSYADKPGCYIMCYSHQQSKTGYKISTNIFAVGQIRVPGEYVGPICRPSKYGKEDISASDHFKQMCNTQIDACKKSKDCWAGGDTGGWYGM